MIKRAEDVLPVFLYMIMEVGYLLISLEYTIIIGFVKEVREMFVIGGEQAVIAILVNVFFIGISFYGLQAIMIEKIIKKNRVFQAQLFYILASIVIGSIVANFFLNLMTWSRQLSNLFG